MYNEEETKVANEKLEELLNKDKKKWMTDIQDLVNRIRDIRNLSA